MRLLLSSLGQRFEAQSISLASRSRLRAKGLRVTRVLERLKYRAWAAAGEPGSFIENAYIETFDARFPNECLNEQWFTGLPDAQRKIKEWRQDYNQWSSHSASHCQPQPQAMEKTSVKPPWKTLSRFPFPAVPAAAVLSRPTLRDSHYDPKRGTSVKHLIDSI